jgi:hypothetical protein
MLNYKLNKRAQVGETVSWIVATLVIIGILIIFIYVSVLMSKVKVVGIGAINFYSESGVDILAQKTSFAYNLTNNKNKELIDGILLKENG